MRILLANKFYYRRGGDCVYTINLQELLEANGHEVAIFAMQFPDNLPTKWQKYFPSEVSFSPRKPIKFFKAIFRPFFSFEVWWKFRKLINDFKPDVVHLNNIHTQLSPLIAKMAHDRGIKVVWTLHDYKLLCPRYDCLREGKSCELCVHGDQHKTIAYRCVKGSILASLVAWLEIKIWNRERLDSYVDTFICPSRFIREKMTQGGYEEKKLCVKYNFMNEEKTHGPDISRGNHYCFVGRLSKEKGIQTLLRVAAQLPYPLKVVGTGPLEPSLRAEFSAFPQIEFFGHCDWPRCREILAGAVCCVIPSEWYENNPLSLVESLMLGTPVLCADIGGLPEMASLSSQVSSFTSGDSADLEKQIRAIFQKPFLTKELDCDFFSGSTYWTALKSIYNTKEFAE
jgi:glycosyltransferase involved in cell wall biosynthesis